MQANDEVVPRRTQKERTRQALLDAALELTADHGFAGVSLRQVARDAGVVPTAFYRHFASMDDLGLALVEQTFTTLREMARDARSDPANYDDIINVSASVIVTHVRAHRSHFAFIARERFGGVPAVRRRIRAELRLFVSELAVDLRTLPYISAWESQDVQMAARLFVSIMVSTAEQVIETPEARDDLLEEIEEDTRRQMRLIVLGFASWHPPH
ncbi:AcrR family transcriptional regulator [Mumia flava]|uniref:AcrR family transcriptional regulator n=1 Tax=Mumia flava TaxID=1348852 RepID=A0A2M9BDZ4_9ACTN|nr:TetR family transcriptional regulator [Mumia flava]PJJ56166.1 AcrR family transcriptional regulator [Mumia flava]